jgi:hypothetical protein
LEYNLGEQAFVDTFDSAAELGRKVRTVIGKLAVGLFIRWESYIVVLDGPKWNTPRRFNVLQRQPLG